MDQFQQNRYYIRQSEHSIWYRVDVHGLNVVQSVSF